MTLFIRSFFIWKIRPLPWNDLFLRTSSRDNEYGALEWSVLISKRAEICTEFPRIGYHKPAQNNFYDFHIWFDFCKKTQSNMINDLHLSTLHHDEIPKVFFFTDQMSKLSSDSFNFPSSLHNFFISHSSTKKPVLKSTKYMNND